MMGFEYEIVLKV